MSVSKEHQKNLKVLSKIISVVAKIGKVITMIAIPFVIIGLSMLVFIVNAIRVDNKNIHFELAGKSLSFVENTDNYSIKMDNDVIGTASDEDVGKVLSIVNKHSKFYLNCWVVLSCAAIVAVLVLARFMLEQIELLFTNINAGDTPFTEENVIHLRKAASYMIALFATSVVVSMFNDMVFKDVSSIDIRGTSIMQILFLYTLSYIFEYGCKLQKESKLKIYE